MMATLSWMILLAVTGPSTAVSVDGDGYLRVLEGEDVLYATALTLTVDQGQLVDAQGRPVVPRIRVPQGVQRLQVELDGEVLADGKSVGRLVLALPGPDAHIRDEQQGRFRFTGRMILREPGEGLAGVVRMRRDDRSAPRAAQVVNPAPRPVPTTEPAQSAQTEMRAAQPVKAGAPDRVAIRLHPRAETGGTRIVLGDIADFGGDPALVRLARQVELGDAPAFGVERRLDTLSVRARLIQAGVKAEQIEFVESQTTLVRRASQEIAHESFVTEAQAAVPDESTSVSGGVAPRPMVAPRGTVRLQVEAVRRSGSQITVTIAAFVDEKRFNARTVTLRVTPKATLKVGQTVVVVVRSGGVAVQTKGTVRRVDGSTGQVTVQIETGRQLTGEVSAQGHVEVKA